MSALYSYFLNFSLISKATLIGSSSNNIENFPVQSDQTNPGLGWKEPMRGLTTRPTPARIAENADLSLRPDGFYSFNLGWLYWTQGQMAYILNAGWSSANLYANTLAAPCTVQTFSDSAYVAFQGLVYRPVWGTNGQYDTEDGGYKNVVLRFVKGTIIT